MMACSWGVAMGRDRNGQDVPSWVMEKVPKVGCGDGRTAPCRSLEIMAPSKQVNCIVCKSHLNKTA